MPKCAGAKDSGKSGSFRVHKQVGFWFA